MSDIQFTDNKLVVTKYEMTVTNALYSSLIGVVREYFTSLFPPTYLKQVFIGNSIAAVTEQPLDDDLKNMKPLPRMSIKMNYENQTGDTSFLADPFLMANMYTFRGANRERMYTKIVYDEETKTYISAITSRARHNFDIIISNKTEMESINIKGYLSNKLGTNRYRYLNDYSLEVPLPASSIGYIAKHKGYNLKDKDSLNLFAEWIHKISDGKVTYKTHHSTGKKQFFYRYGTNILIRIPNFEVPDAQKDNKAVSESMLRFTVEVEYNNHNYFIAESYNLANEPIDDEFLITEGGMNEVGMHWTLNWGIPHQIGNKKSILGLELVTEANSPIEEIDFGEQLARAPNYYIDYLRSQDNFDELKATNLIYKLFRDRKELIEDEDYQINWKTKVITILSPYANYDYKFFMYAPISEVNDLYDEYLQKNRADVNNVIVES